MCDYVLFQLNKNRTFEYCKRYNLKEPTNEISDLMVAVQSRLGLQCREAAYSNFLVDFRDGTLGKIVLD